MDPFLGEVRLFAFPSIIPRGWLPCDGRLLPIMQNQALFALLNTQYGGDGRTTFGLPDLRGRVPVNLNPASSFPGMQGFSGGAETVALDPTTMPVHLHALDANSGAANQTTPSGSFFASGAPSQLLYGPPANTVALDTGTLSDAGSAAAHPNLQPFLTLQYCIAASGIFPPRQ